MHTFNMNKCENTESKGMRETARALGRLLRAAAGSGQRSPRGCRVNRSCRITRSTISPNGANSARNSSSLVCSGMAPTKSFQQPPPSTLPLALPVEPPPSPSPPWPRPWPWPWPWTLLLLHPSEPEGSADAVVVAEEGERKGAWSWEGEEADASVGVTERWERLAAAAAAAVAAGGGLFSSPGWLPAAAAAACPLAAASAAAATPAVCSFTPLGAAIDNARSPQRKGRDGVSERPVQEAANRLASTTTTAGPSRACFPPALPCVCACEWYPCAVIGSWRMWRRCACGCAALRCAALVVRWLRCEWKSGGPSASTRATAVEANGDQTTTRGERKGTNQSKSRQWFGFVTAAATEDGWRGGAWAWAFGVWVRRSGLCWSLAHRRSNDHKKTKPKHKKVEQFQKKNRRHAQHNRSRINLDRH